MTTGTGKGAMESYATEFPDFHDGSAEGRYAAHIR